MANIVHLNYVRSYPIWFAREKQVLVLKYILLKLSNAYKLTLLMITGFFCFITRSFKTERYKMRKHICNASLSMFIFIITNVVHRQTIICTKVYEDKNFYIKTVSPCVPSFCRYVFFFF